MASFKRLINDRRVFVPPMKLSRCMLVGLASLLTPAMAHGQTAWGIGKAKDGDSLTVGDQEVRLFGVDAPEFDQACKRDGQNWSCGAAAAEQLMTLVTGRDVQCVSMGTDQHGRMLGRCTVDGVDINRAMVASGHAIAYRRYSTDYVEAEQTAKTAKLGVWSGTFETPEQYRRTGGLPVEKRSTRSVRRAASAASDTGCIIKGNRNRKGEWIYHLPWMPYYEPTRAEEIFCSEAAAQAAGYRHAIVRR
jgi:endonuclease YncB( thermonuclease family)